MNTLLLKRIYSISLILLVGFHAFSQQDWNFGNKYHAYVGTPSSILRVKMTSSSLGSIGFVSRVGGVAFHAVAVPSENLNVFNLKIEYVFWKEDGHRLRVTLAHDTIYPYIPDWQLIPIAKYADNEYNSCVSLFGPESDEDHYDIVYNSELQNTLLGIRILQADMALMDMESQWQLPKFDNKTILGLGESEPDISCRNAASDISNLLSGDDFGSWVLTDDKRPIKFNITNGTLSFTGTPYYYFWTTKSDMYRNQYYELAYKAIEDSLRDDNTAFTNDLIQLNALAYKIEHTDTSILNKVIPATKAIDNLKNQYSLLLKFNPPVYKAVLNTVRYGAFFRYIKKTHPDNWKNFTASTYFAKVSPSVKTPTTLPTRGIIR